MTQPGNTYLFDFQGEATRAVIDFPATLADTVFFDTRNIRYFCFSFNSFDFHPGKTAVHPANYLAALDESGFHGRLLYKQSFADHPPECKTRCLVLGKTESAREIQAFADFFVFQHELGHLVMPGAFDKEEKPLKKEFLAEAFAAIRFLQQFPAEKDFLILKSKERAENALKGDTDHATSSVIDKVLAESEWMNFQASTPAQTTKLAEKYALDALGMTLKTALAAFFPAAKKHPVIKAVPPVGVRRSKQKRELTYY